MFVTWGTGVYCVKNVVIAFFNLGFDFLMVWCIHSMIYKSLKLRSLLGQPKTT